MGRFFSRFDEYGKLNLIKHDRISLNLTAEESESQDKASLILNIHGNNGTEPCLSKPAPEHTNVTEHGNNGTESCFSKQDPEHAGWTEHGNNRTEPCLSKQY